MCDNNSIHIKTVFVINQLKWQHEMNHFCWYTVVQQMQQFTFVDKVNCYKITFVDKFNRYNILSNLNKFCTR